MPGPHAFRHVKLVHEGRAAYSENITTPSDAVTFFQKHIGTSVQEHFTALFLNARNVPLGWHEVSRGTVSASLVHPREVFAPAIVLTASSLVLVHNHPSGDATPSRDDIELTHRLTQAGELLGIEILDHLIITAEGYFSLKDHGLL